MINEFKEPVEEGVRCAIEVPQMHGGIWLHQSIQGAAYLQGRKTFTDLCRDKGIEKIIIARTLLGK